MARSTATAEASATTTPAIAYAAKAIAADAAVVAGVGFDPTIVIAIITAVMQLLANCKKAEADAVETFRSPGLLARAALRRECRDRTRSAREAQTLADACRDYGRTASRDELARMLAEAKAAA